MVWSSVHGVLSLQDWSRSGLSLGLHCPMHNPFKLGQPRNNGAPPALPGRRLDLPWPPQAPNINFLHSLQHRLPGMDGAEEGRLAMGNSCTYQRLQCFMLLRVGRVLCEGMSRPLVVRVRTLACSPSAASYLSLTCLPSH